MQMQKANNFQTGKVQPDGVASFLLNFLPISAWCCLKVKKKLPVKSVCSKLRNVTRSLFLLEKKVFLYSLEI